ncbi:9400_t:CDS:2 [Racocetra persica]|uniref:9400_t:CDS:1 n=1 Tax=Racocetra persica TaxID=160502 RepID=A0ACA9KTP6_9GLOM|nr:9400_t:CDS:2 [Racocetra persica]
MSSIRSESESTDENTILPSEADSPRTITDLDNESAPLDVIFEPTSYKYNHYKEATNYDTLLSDQLIKVQEPLYSDADSTHCSTSIVSPSTLILEPSVLTEEEIAGNITRKVDVRAKNYSSDNESCSTFRDSSDNEAYIQKRKKNKVIDNTIRTSFYRNLSSTTSTSSTTDNTKYEYQQPKIKSCSKFRTVINFSKSKFEIRNYFVPGNEDWKKLNMSLHNLDNLNYFNKLDRSHKEVEENLTMTNNLAVIENLGTSPSSDFSETSNISKSSNSSQTFTAFPNNDFDAPSQILSKHKYFKPSDKDWKRLQWSVDESNWNITNNIVDMKFSAGKTT